MNPEVSSDVFYHAKKLCPSAQAVWFSRTFWHAAEILTRTAAQKIMGKHTIILIVELKAQGKWLQPAIPEPACLISPFSIYALSTENT